MEDKYKGVKKGKKIYSRLHGVYLQSPPPPPPPYSSASKVHRHETLLLREDVRLTYLCVLITRLFCPADWLSDILDDYLTIYTIEVSFFSLFFLPLLFNLHVQPFRNERGYSEVAVLQVCSAQYPQATSFSNIKLSGQRPLQLPLQMARKFLQKDHQNRPCNLYSLAC